MPKALPQRNLCKDKLAKKPLQRYVGGMTEQPSERVYLNAETLKGVAHPIRLRLLGLLREDGPSTATKLAERIGQSSGVTSYHLRQLAEFGFIEDAAEAGTGGRERWWKAAHRSTTLDADPIRQAPVEAEVYMRAIASAYAERIDRWLGEMTMLPSDWDESATLSDYNLRLSAAEAAELLHKLAAVIDSYRADRAGETPPAGTEKVVVQLQMLPFVRAIGEALGTPTGEAPGISTEDAAGGER